MIGTAPQVAVPIFFWATQWSLRLKTRLISNNPLTPYFLKNVELMGQHILGKITEDQ